MGTKLYRGSPPLFRDSFFLFEKTVYLIPSKLIQTLIFPQKRSKIGPTSDV
jgi:hypothetical protein